MITTLQNDIARAQINSLGAELTSFTRKDSGTEYIWSGDAAYWTGRSPVLFPIIGAARGGAIKVGGQSYPLANHGFARRSEFTLVESSETSAIYRLSQDEKTLAGYPYSFNLFLEYTLAESTLTIAYRVENPDEGDIHFQLGTHPAFNCPPDGQGSFHDYLLEFEQPETLERLFLDDTGLIITGRSEPVLTQSDTLPLSHELFASGALVFQDIRSRRITLKRKDGGPSVAVSFANFPDLGIWQPRNAPFVCIEPWHGIADTDAYTGELSGKEGVITLPPGGQFTSSLKIEFN